MGRAALGRRRGTRRNDGGRTLFLVGLVFCLLIVALLLGVVLGTQYMSSTTTATSSSAAGVGVHQLLRGKQGIPAKTMDQLNALIRKHNKLAHDDDQHLQQAKPMGHVHDNDNDDGNNAEQQLQHDHAADAASGQTDTFEEAAAQDPTKAYPYSLEPVPSVIDFTTWTAKGGDRFAEYKDGGMPWRITTEILEQSDNCARSRREHVKNAMKFAWAGYTKYAFGNDEVLPQSRGTSNNWGGMGTTLVDSLDTLWLMGLKDEFWKARDWVRDRLEHGHVGSVSVFETTIRSLGGLLSAYDWSGDKAFLDKAHDLGKRLFKAFDNPTGLPYGQVSLSSGATSNIGWAGGNGIIAEMGTLQIEFRYLGRAVNNPEFATTSEHVFEILDKMPHQNGLYPYYVRNRSNPPSFANNKLTFGAMADSLYEYMLKVWLQGGRKEPLYRNMYDRAIQGMHEDLLKTSTPSGLTYIADKNGAIFDHKMDHLVCFMGGLLALGAYTDPQGLGSARAQRDLKTAKVWPKHNKKDTDACTQPLTLFFLANKTGSNLHLLSNVRKNEYGDIPGIHSV